MSPFKRFIFLLALFLGGISSVQAKAPDYYQLRVYHCQNRQQASLLDAYLKDALLPGLHRYGIKSVGVFKPVSPDSLDQITYVFMPLKRLDELLRINYILGKDSQYLSAAKAFIEASFDQPTYTRMESILLLAFTGMPAFALPKLNSPKRDRVYELRSYESATEALATNKIGMFNDAEMSIFKHLNFNPVFYGQVISGSKMPNLMYLTTFENKADRDKHWADFGVEYKKISGLPQYQHNVSKNTTLFLYPADYSDF